MNKSGIGPILGNSDFQVEFPFGPAIYNAFISQDFYDRLVTQIEVVRNDPSTFQQANLAGNFNIGSSKNINPELFQRDIAEHTANYLEIMYETGRFPTELLDSNNQIIIRNWKAVNMWANYQRAGDFNPIHVHTEQLSFVIYTSIPKEIQQENVISNTQAHGQIYFTFGEQKSFTPNSINYTPTERKILMFPADLRHYVWPFFSNVERISVSGNIRFMGN
jgi:hypothetical protein